MALFTSLDNCGTFRIGNFIYAKSWYHIGMTTVTLDRFGRIVIPRELRQRHGWRPGTVLELQDGPDGCAVGSVLTRTAPPAGLEWRDGLLVCSATATADITDLAAWRDTLDAERDRDLSGLP